MTWVVGYGNEGTDVTRVRKENWLMGTFILQFSATVANTGSGVRPSDLLLEA
jgi:hypothetical protein